MAGKWFRKGRTEDAQSLAAEERDQAESRRAAAAQRIVRESLDRDRVALELAAKTIFRVGNVR